MVNVLCKIWSAKSNQTHWVSSADGCSMTALGRSIADRHCSHTVGGPTAVAGQARIPQHEPDLFERIAQRARPHRNPSLLPPPGGLVRNEFAEGRGDSRPAVVCDNLRAHSGASRAERAGALSVDMARFPDSTGHGDRVADQTICGITSGRACRRRWWPSRSQSQFAVSRWLSRRRCCGARCGRTGPRRRRGGRPALRPWVVGPPVPPSRR
jgi:hypothetical protein